MESVRVPVPELMSAKNLQGRDALVRFGFQGMQVGGVLDAHSGQVWQGERNGNLTQLAFSVPVARAGIAPRGSRRHRRAIALTERVSG